MIEVINSARNINKDSSFEIELFFLYTRLHKSPKHEIIKNEIMKGSEWLDRCDNDDGQNDNHYKLRYFYRELYDYENLINWLRRNNDIEERKVLYACWLICFLRVVFLFHVLVLLVLSCHFLVLLGSFVFLSHTLVLWLILVSVFNLFGVNC